MRGSPAISSDSRDALGKRRQLARVLQRIAGRDDPPELVERQPAQRDLGDQRMAGMRRVERAAEQPDLHAFLGMRHAEIARRDVGGSAAVVKLRALKAASGRCRARGI